LSGMKSVVAGVLITLLSFPPRLRGQQAKAQSEDTGPRAKASQTTSANDTAQRRQRILESIRTEDSPELIAERRMFCAQGGEPERVRKARGEGADFYPDASDACLTVFRRDVEDGRPLELYEQLVKNGKGSAKPQELLNAIATAAMKDKLEVSIGGEIVEASPALSLDAGYTKASLDKTTMASLGVADTQENARKLKGIAEGCLDGQNKNAPSPSTCYVAGLTLGAKNNSSKGAG
jgi:hypothetical protein